MQGNVVEAGTTNFGVNVAGFVLHSAIHSARPDIKCIIHLHLPNIVAVSTDNFIELKIKTITSRVCKINLPDYQNVRVKLETVWYFIMLSNLQL